MAKQAGVLLMVINNGDVGGRGGCLFGWSVHPHENHVIVVDANIISGQSILSIIIHCLFSSKHEHVRVHSV